jgi:hypothetical protein
MISRDFYCFAQTAPLSQFQTNCLINISLEINKDSKLKIKFVVMMWFVRQIEAKCVRQQFKLN